MRRRSLFLVALQLTLSACGGLRAARVFDPIGDYATTAQKSLAEGGHSQPVVPPAGITWAGRVVAFEESGEDGALPSHYELQLTITDDAAESGAWRAAPSLAGVELVDDEGIRLPCTQVIWPEETTTAESGAPARQFRLRFDVPAGYRFKQIGTVAVRWTFTMGAADPLQVTSRFRVG